MTITSASGKAKGSRLEKEAAALLGGRRAPLSGAIGGGDIWFDGQGVFADSFIFEAKARAKLPQLLTMAMNQAQIACVGTNKKPAVVYKQDRGEIMVAFRLADLVQFCEALAEVGNGYAIRNHLRQARKEMEAAERLI